MSLFQSSMTSPTSLSEKFSRHTLADFVGLEKPRKVKALSSPTGAPSAAL